MSHIHNVVDTDPHYKIDGTTRTIVNIDETKRMLVQGDHNSERLTFEIPRYIDGHDFLDCNVVEVHYENKDTMGKNLSSSFYVVDDLHAKGESEEDKNVIVLSWLVEGGATVYAGTLDFSIHFKCVSGYKIEYSWNTTTFEGITIKPAICNSKKVESEYPDIIAQLVVKVNTLENKIDNTTINSDSLILEDQNTGKQYKIYVFNGKLTMTSVETESE